MTQDEQVIAAMKQNGGYATLGQLYQKVDVSNWGTKTPFASIRRIVQKNAAFFRIRAGLWALEEFRDKLPSAILPPVGATQAEKETSAHYYYQGLLVELGNMENQTTYVPAQDKNRPFLGTTLGEIAQTTRCLEFTYTEVIERIKSIDVIWFNQRRYPHAVYEVENSTDFQNSLGKFIELQDFSLEFWIVAAEVRKKEFESKVGWTMFQPIAKRVKFLSYEQLSEWHDKTYEHLLAKP
jgi:hypothetical protein